MFVVCLVYENYILKSKVIFYYCPTRLEISRWVRGVYYLTPTPKNHRRARIHIASKKILAKISTFFKTFLAFHLSRGRGHSRIPTGSRGMLMLVYVVLEAEVDPIRISRAPLTKEIRKHIRELIGAKSMG